MFTGVDVKKNYAAEIMPSQHKDRQRCPNEVDQRCYVRKQLNQHRLRRARAPPCFVVSLFRCAGCTVHMAFAVHFLLLKLPSDVHCQAIKHHLSMEILRLNDIGWN